MLDENDNAFSFAIAPVLQPALRALRRTETDRTLWIDAICINQDDMAERNAQVAMMADIYDRAMNVCVWLGEGDESSQRALNFIQRDVL